MRAFLVMQILCQEDSYFLKLVRYIHLNLLRAGMVQDYKSLGQGRAVHFREVGSAGSGDIWDGGRRYLVVGQIRQNCARTECILLLGGERAWDARNGGGAAAEIDPAGSVYFSEERAAHRQRKGLEILGEQFFIFSWTYPVSQPDSGNPIVRDEMGGLAESRTMAEL